MLTLGWSDGYSFVPTGFAILSSANKDNRYQDIDNEIDKRTKEVLLKNRGSFSPYKRCIVPWYNC